MLLSLMINSNIIIYSTDDNDYNNLWIGNKINRIASLRSYIRFQQCYITITKWRLHYTQNMNDKKSNTKQQPYGG